MRLVINLYAPAASRHVFQSPRLNRVQLTAALGTTQPCWDLRLSVAPTIQHEGKLLEGIRLNGSDPGKGPFQRHYGEQNERSRYRKASSHQ